MNRTVRVVVVDDSAFIRKALVRMIAKDPEIEVIAEGRDGAEGAQLVEKLRPDVVTLDVEMPRMNGLEALKAIMRTAPTPVIMVSSLTSEGARITLEALDLGAVDFVAKNIDQGAVQIAKLQAELIGKIKAASVARIRGAAAAAPAARAVGDSTVGSSPTPAPAFARPSTAAAAARKVALVAIGSSTGGPQALQRVLAALPATLPVGVVVVQHMPATFLEPFAKRLDGLTAIKVELAVDGALVEPGKALVAPGGAHCKILRRATGEPRVALDPNPADTLHRPSVDELMLSAAKAFPGAALGVILTGMGSDGTLGMQAIKRGGGATLAQDAETCVVYGMPKSAFEAGAVDKQLGLDAIAAEIVARARA